MAHTASDSNPSLTPQGPVAELGQYRAGGRPGSEASRSLTRWPVLRCACGRLASTSLPLPCQRGLVGGVWVLIPGQAMRPLISAGQWARTAVGASPRLAPAPAGIEATDPTRLSARKPRQGLLSQTSFAPDSGRQQRSLDPPAHAPRGAQGPPGGFLQHVSICPVAWKRQTPSCKGWG